MQNLQDRPPLSPPALAESSGFPARGFPFSLVLHSVVVTGILLLRFVPGFQFTNPTRHQPRELAVVLPLEAIQSPSAGQSGPPGKSAPSTTSHAKASRSMANSFAGPQHVISDTKDPDNSVQTILQPDVRQPRRLPYPIATPSVVKMAMPQPAPVITAGETRPAIQPPPPPPAWRPPTPHAVVEAAPVSPPDLLVAAPKLPAFVTPVSNYAPQPSHLPTPQKPAPAAPSAQTAPQKPTQTPPAKPSPPTPAAQPSPTQQAQINAPPAKTAAGSGSGKDDRNLLIVNAVETQGTANDQMIAQSEIHGKFEVSPVNVPLGAKSSPGDMTPDKKPGTGSGSATPSQASSSTGAPNGQATGKDSGTSPSGSSSNSTTAQGRGTGTRGTSTGSAPQGASGSTSPFGSISIQGGTSSGGRPGAGGSSASPRPANAPPAQNGSYNMTIISSGSSGGGLRDFGTFRDGPVYTVYLDVSSIGIQGTRWSLQYAAARDARLAHPGALLTPPFPSRQVLPKFPAARVASNIARLFVVQADIGTEGTFESIQILQTPDLTLNALLKQCLLQWTFKAASMGAEPVAVRVLIGIPIAAIMAQTPDVTP